MGTTSQRRDVWLGALTLCNSTLHPPNAGIARFTVRSAPRALSLSAALRPLCCALPTYDLTLGVRG